MYDIINRINLIVLGIRFWHLFGGGVPMDIIYIADDDKNVCNLLKSHLKKENYNVEGFYDAESLLERFSEAPCDMIITDIMMPNISGYDLCKEIRKKVMYR